MGEWLWLNNECGCAVHFIFIVTSSIFMFSQQNVFLQKIQLTQQYKKPPN